MKKRFVLIIPIILGLFCLVMGCLSYFKIENVIESFSRIRPDEVSKEILISELVETTNSTSSFLKGFMVVSGLLVVTSAGFLRTCFKNDRLQ